MDLDGTLIRSDLLVESALAYIKPNPLRGFQLLGWLAGGKANLKGHLAAAVTLDVAHLPFDSAVLAMIAEEKAKGRPIILATASHRKFADQVSAHLGHFDFVMATDGAVNLSANAKRDALVAKFGKGGFDYLGNSADDLPIWAASGRAYAVNPSDAVERKARALGNLEHVFKSNPGASWTKAMRLHQWAKNLLLFVPLLAGHRVAEIPLLVNAVIAFIVFGLCASSVYLLNDLFDLADDRQHPTKRDRPFASGKLDIRLGLIAVPLLLIAAFAGSIAALPWQFTAALSTYYVLTLAYSLGLKRLMMIDVTVLALLYTLRVIAGAFAIEVEPTFWILAFSMFIFLSFGLVKRYTELHQLRLRSSDEKARGRGYSLDDLGMISGLGAASGYISVLILALYIQDQSTVALYRHHEVIWLACPLLLFWISRVWLLTYRGQMHEDPVVFAFSDRVSLVVGVLFGLVFWLAT